MPPIEEDLTEAQQHYFKSGGDVTDALVAENKDTPAQETPVVESPPTVPVETPPTDVHTSVESDDGDDDAPEAAKPGEPQPERQRRRVSRREFESERQARLKAEQTLQEQAVRNARVEERLSLLQQALQEPTQPEAQAPARPDPEQDIFGYVRWLEEQHNAVRQEVDGYKEQIQTGQAEMDSERRYFNALNSFAGQRPDFVNAYSAAIRGRAAQLIGEKYPDVTDEQLAGVREGKIQIPDPIADQLRQEERSLYRTAFEQNRDPAAVLYRYAQSFGYRPPVPQQQQPQPKTNGATPASAPLGGTATPRQSQPQGAPTATDVIASIQRGQAAASSLSKAGGTAPDTELTPQALADMSEEQFAALFNELQNSGNKSKLMKLMGE